MLLLVLVASCKSTASESPPAEAQPASASSESETVGDYLLLHEVAAAIDVPKQDCATAQARFRVLTEVKTQDRWGTPLRLVCAPGSWGVASAGADRLWNSADDQLVLRSEEARVYE